jgi:hypothetical protein
LLVAGRLALFALRPSALLIKPLAFSCQSIIFLCEDKSMERWIVGLLMFAKVKGKCHAGASFSKLAQNWIEKGFLRRMTSNQGSRFVSIY